MSDTERYLGFYTQDPFWTFAKPEISKIKTNQGDFIKEFSKVIVKSTNKDFKLKICRDGFIILQINRLENLRSSLKNKHDQILEFNSEYLSYLNTFQFLLASETYLSQRFNFFRNGSLSTDEIFNITFENNKIIGIGTPYRDITQHFFLGRYLENYNLNQPIEKDYRITRRGVIEKNVFDQCIVNFKKLFKDTDSFFLFSQINSSFSEFSNLNFRQCVTLAWFCIEYFINKDWINFLHSKKNALETITRINSERRSILLGKDYSASIMSNILELNDILPLDIFQKIDNIRSKRNNIVHNLDRIKKLSNVLKEKPENKENKPIQLLDCLDCFDVIKYYTKKYYNFEIRFPVGFTYRQI